MQPGGSFIFFTVDGNLIFGNEKYIFNSHLLILKKANVYRVVNFGGTIPFLCRYLHFVNAPYCRTYLGMYLDEHAEQTRAHATGMSHCGHFYFFKIERKDILASFYMCSRGHS